MFQHRHSSRSGFTYDLTYPTFYNHLVRGFEITKRVVRRDTPSVCVAKYVSLEESINMTANHCRGPNQVYRKNKSKEGAPIINHFSHGRIRRNLRRKELLLPLPNLRRRNLQVLQI